MPRPVVVALPGKRYAKLPVVHDCVVTAPLEAIVRHCPACVERFVIASDVEVALFAVMLPVLSVVIVLEPFTNSEVVVPFWSEKF